MAWGRAPMRRILSDADERRVVEAIVRAESGTSGEIRVHVESRARKDAMTAARFWFARLGMDRTEERNGVLIYVAVADRAFAVVGDEGIHGKVGEAGWSALRDAMAARFRAAEFAEGLVGAIETSGAWLAEHFPRKGDDVNELPDSVSRS